VPARFGECHCGVTRAQALAAARADEPPPRPPLTLFGLAWRLGAGAAAMAVALAVASVYFPAEPAVEAPPPTTTLPRATARRTPSPPVAATPAWPDDAPLWVPPPDQGAGHEAPPATTPPEPTEADLLSQKTEQWRARYRPVAERVERLQREVVTLESGVVPYDSADPGRNEHIRRMNELVRERLEAARRDLEAAQKQLGDIEEAAQLDGIPAGQLR
jgi:hypothetical protein